VLVVEGGDSRDCSEDLGGNGSVDVMDPLQLLGAFGSC